MNLKRLEVTEDRLHEGRDVYLKGAVEVFDMNDPDQASIANKWQQFGWAKDVETGETGERKPGTVSLEPDAVIGEA